MTERPAQSLPVVSIGSSPSPSLASAAAAGPESQGSSNKVGMTEQPAQSLPLMSIDSSPNPLLTPAAAGPTSKNSSKTSARVIRVATPARINNDPFRSMRLNIDNMSYEELLALQEKIGHVSTGLSGKELVKARKITTYRVKRRKTTDDNEVDSKCSICQEEYLTGDKLGSLKCKHRYHVACIEQWLRQKNWCPTCKTDARACL